MKQNNNPGGCLNLHSRKMTQTYFKPHVPVSWVTYIGSSIVPHLGSYKLRIYVCLTHS